MLRRSKNVSLVLLAAIAAAACDENKAQEEIKHCVDENGVVQEDSKCHDAPVQPPTGSDGGQPAPHSGGGGGHFFWYYGGTRTPVAPGGRVGGGSYAPSPGRTYSSPSSGGGSRGGSTSSPSIGRGGFGGTGAGHAGGGGGGGS